MTKAEKILEILSPRGIELRGLDIVKKSDGTLHRGTIYIHLKELEDDSDITVRTDESGLRFYSLSDITE